MTPGDDPVFSEEVGARTGNAVSYTHLRAHETELDLVCRLLLEQNKETRPHTKCALRP